MNKCSDCSCGPECNCPCCSSKVPYFVITELVSGDVTIKVANPVKIDC